MLLHISSSSSLWSWVRWWQRLWDLYATVKGDNDFSSHHKSGGKSTDLGTRKPWVPVKAWLWANHFSFWVSASSFVSRAAKFSKVLLFCELVLMTEGDVRSESNCWSLYFQPRKVECEERQGGNWTGKLLGESGMPTLQLPCLILSCYSNQTNLQLKMRNPSPHTHSTSKLKTFYRLVNLQLRWCSKEQLWSNFDNDENNNHMARFRALLLQLQCSWIDKSD